MAHVGFLSKFVTNCSGKEVGFDCKNNHARNNSANFQLDIIGKINCKTLVIMSYSSSGLELKKIQPVRKDFR